jgi:YVTN family beta-propeller protein
MPGGLRVVASATAVAVLCAAQVRASTATVAPASPRAAVYTAVTARDISPAVAGDPERVYVPDSGGGTVEVIDPATFAVVDRLVVGPIPHHVTPSWDLRYLYVDNEGFNSLTVIDPRTAKPAGTVPAVHPYNLYFTPDGSKAIDVVERLSRLDFLDPHSWRLLKSVPIPCCGVDHMDFSADGTRLLVSTEFAGVLVEVDTRSMAVTRTLRVGGYPIDVRLSPDGATFLVANQARNGVSIVDAAALREVGFVPTGRGAHGLVLSRDAGSFYVSNRYEGSVSVLDAVTHTVRATWRFGGSPDMMTLSPDGTRLWVSGRFDRAVYVLDTTTGALLHRIAVGASPHGLCFFPNVGAVSLGHNGMYR